MKLDEILQLLFIATSVISIAVLNGSYIMTVILKVKKRTSLLLLADTSSVKDIVKCGFWCSSGFAFLKWLLCASTVVAGGNDSLSAALMTLGGVWGITFLLGLLVEAVLKLLKSGTALSVLDAVKSAFGYSLLYFVLSFLIA